jgi:hypothetical protein
MHLIDKHMFPKNYFFAVTKAGIDGRRSLLADDRYRQRRAPTTSEPPRTRDFDEEQAVERLPAAGVIDDRRGTLPPKPSDSAEAEKMVTASSQETPNDTQADSMPLDDPAECITSPEEDANVEMADLAGAMSALRFVPASVRFGRGRGRMGFTKS